MRWIVITLAILSILAQSASGQSWIFAPGPYSQKQGPVAPATTSRAHAYATFTESQAAQAALIPAPAFRWDPTGVIGRGDRQEVWRHQERMEATRLHTYARGVRDATAPGPIWSLHAPVAAPLPAPRPLPPVIGSPPPGRPQPQLRPER